METREQYLERLNKWLNDARLWHSYCAGFPQFYMNNVNRFNISNENSDNFNQNLFQRRTNVTSSNRIPDANTGIPQPIHYEFVIPPVWKRVTAELVDFFILLVIKMVMTLMLLEGFNLMNKDYNAFESLQKNIQDMRSLELLTLEVVYRSVACAYETYFLKGGQCATPGKRTMGLMVIRVKNIRPVAGAPVETIRVTRCSTLGMKKSFIRAILKNIFIGLMLPICLVLYFFKFNRTAYDIMADSIVVENQPNRPGL